MVGIRVDNFTCYLCRRFVRAGLPARGWCNRCRATRRRIAAVMGGKGTLPAAQVDREARIMRYCEMVAAGLPLFGR